MKNEKRLIKAFGDNEYGFADLPNKISGAIISRIIVCAMTNSCPYCFPHGIECENSHYNNRQRTWKKHRKTQWKKLQ
jgi:hypothetical protein